MSEAAGDKFVEHLKEVKPLWPETPEARTLRAPAQIKRRNERSHAIRVQNLSASKL